MNKSSPVLNKIEKEFQKHHGVMKMSEAVSLGYNSRDIYRLRNEGKLVQLSRGIYKLADAPEPAYVDLVTVALRIPKAVICLISALNFHGLTTEIPHYVYLALPPAGEVSGTQPKLDYPSIRVFRFSGNAYTEGIEAHNIDGFDVNIYSPTKTVADIFKFRNQLGIDVALEALKFFRKRKDFNIDKLLRYARICHVEKTLMPYLEAIV